MAAVTEEAIRERVNLRHQNLADVRSLSLPGTYHEKITHLGNSLKNFTRLKSLDLSRNALVSLEGIQHLIFLEKLNLYYNHISSLSEIFRLHSLTALKDVDLRLNPVVKNESDYRLFVVHMLPNLRRLDDRPVRDSERKASLLHFTTDHAFELKDSSPTAKVNEIERSGQPRIAYINSMSRKCSVMDEEDEAVLNLITKCEWDLSKPLGITGSAKKDPEVEFHSLQSIRNIEDNVGITMNRKSETRPISLQMRKQQANMPMDVSSETRNALKVQETDEAQAGPVLSAMQKSAPADQQKDSATMCQEVNNLLVEKKTLQSPLSEQDQQYNIKINSLMSELSNSRKDMDILKQRLDQLLEENTNLKAHLLNVEQNVKNADSSSSLHLQLTDLQNENQQLRSENINLKQRLQHYDQIQELTEMLQESHRTLVSTNEHLLQELAETRTRHRTEVEQLHWSYNQLKKTMDKHPHSNMDNSRC
ncbi:centrosomal protein of 72 kDa isoform X4 [Chrysemys picta bellii]|uniref:centrosomal protein of 72 kDa isoform X4 n=1 Tax=Chrysemys picta bellii TaxID=8478 RepID=UPI00046C2B55|nr:centrosomal protein of 72 kDa isoform X4 [Chrysemys picta bellii]